MSKKLSVKLFLAGLWLLCYFPYKEALLVGEDDKVSSVPGEIRHSENVMLIDLRWQYLTMLSEEDINIYSSIKFDEGIPAISRFNDGIAKRDGTWDDILNEYDCLYKISKLLRPRDQDKESEMAMVVHFIESEVEWSQTSHFTTPYFWSLSR